MRAPSKMAGLPAAKVEVETIRETRRSAWSFSRAYERLAGLLVSRRDLQRRLERTEISLAEALETGKSREELVSILAHDLRNSLHSIGFGAEMLTEQKLDMKTARYVESIKLSCARMKELIETVFDLTCARRIGGIPVYLENDGRLADELRHIVAEVQSAHSKATIDVDMDVGVSAVCDRRRIAQMLGNLLTNAVTHGKPNTIVHVKVWDHPRAFEMSVSNTAPEITSSVSARMFQPFCKKESASRSPSTGLGLGLYIAAEIAKSHGGSLEMTVPAENQICFTFRLLKPSVIPDNDFCVERLAELPPKRNFQAETFAEFSVT